ncbi:hypothetical protein [Pantanalinema sp. GBBB05]|uniref:hypothetical protein n=1 Tax=Pantanalinema sp. GBBB05 TaxID=2604139 RepID=UPI001D5926FE|nr:hypothetical protein [Pantanalinema sp. GBBB05]
MLKVSKLYPILLSGLCLYSFSYAVARVTVLQMVEQYAGVEGRGKPRQDYIAKKDFPAGAGWEYQLFLPCIKVEEGIVNFFHNL